jgi:hypothetical protein
MNKPKTRNENIVVQELKVEMLIWIDNRNDEKFSTTSKKIICDREKMLGFWAGQ